MKNRYAQVISAGLGGYEFPAQSRYDDDAWDSDTMLLAWAPWFHSVAFGEEDIVPQYAVDLWLLSGVPLTVTETWAW